MPKVLLKDVVIRIKDKVDKDSTNLEYYIGGEHFDYAEVCITKRGVIQGSTIGPAFHMHFMPGDVLLMSRNPHLRKAGVVDFEGICSDVSYVCRTKDESVLLQRYLPFVFQTDHFWEFAERNKKGSTNFFLNWSDFEKYEFDLPGIEEQRKLTELLWAAQDTKMAYQELLRQSDELVKSQFIEMFGDAKNTPYTLSKVKDIASVRVGIVIQPTKYYSADNCGVKVFRSANVRPFYVDDSDWAYFTVENHEIMAKTHVHTGDVLIVRSGANLGQSCVVSEEYDDFNAIDVLIVSPNTKVIRSDYMCAFVNYPIGRDQILSGQKGIAQKHLNVGVFENAHIPVPPMHKQEAFCELVEQSDKSKFELKESIANITALMKSLMQQDFSN